MNELVVISGKGGTGKTSLVASLALLADRPVLVDCDVDAADLHLVLRPAILERHDFYSGHEAVVRAAECVGCGLCARHCRFGAIGPVAAPGGGAQVYQVDPVACEGCGVCVHVCPQRIIDFPDRWCGHWMVSSTRQGPMVHAALGVAAENSGKLVSTVRREARRIAERDGHDLMIVDGPPGIGCPVIASVTGATRVLVVSEPTVSGEHDLGRVLALTQHFGIPTSVCVNKWDLNPELAERIEENAQDRGAQLAGRIRYDRQVTRAQLDARAVVETGAPSAEDIRRLWQRLALQTQPVAEPTD